MFGKQSKNNMFAALDLGSNSFHLVIAKKEKNRFVFVDRVKIMVRLADGLGPDGNISHAAQERACAAFNFFEERLRGFPIKFVRVVGTNTLRAAKNSDELMERLESILGYPIKVINGREEARLIFLGVTNSLPLIEGGRFVVDIGGGSTELIWGSGRKPEIMESLHMGCVSFSKSYFPKGKITQKGYDQAVLAAQMELSPVEHLFKNLSPGQALGSSGTIKTIEAVLDNMGFLQEGITLEGLRHLASLLVEAGHVDKLKLEGLKDIRKPVFPGGVAVLHAVLKSIPLPPLHASRTALREGVLIELIGRSRNKDQREQTVKNLMRRYSVDVEHATQVERLSLWLLSQLHGDIPYLNNASKRYLRWASSLHEIGLSISHSSYHKHGSYIIQHSDLDGFTRFDKRVLSFLVLNHRRKIRTAEDTGRFKPPWALLLVFRLACLFLRTRNATNLPEIDLTHKPKTIIMKIDDEWLDLNPLTTEQLEQEKAVWNQEGRKFKFIRIKSDQSPDPTLETR